MARVPLDRLRMALLRIAAVGLAGAVGAFAGLVVGDFLFEAHGSQDALLTVADYYLTYQERLPPGSKAVLRVKLFGVWYTRTALDRHAFDLEIKALDVLRALPGWILMVAGLGCGIVCARRLLRRPAAQANKWSDLQSS